MSHEQTEAATASIPVVDVPNENESKPRAAISARTVPATQRSWRAVAKGAPARALSLSSDTPVPQPKKGEILVKVQAVSLNPVGYKLLKFFPGWIVRRVKAHEFDLAGVVVDANGTEFKAGDEIFGHISPIHVFKGGYGALAEYTSVAAATAVIRPKNITPTQAAGLPIAGLTAYQSLFGLAKLEAGQSMFINGGSTAVGSFAIQLAKAKGAKVATSASGRNEQYVRSLGADEFFDYTKAPLHEQLIAAGPNPKYHSPAYLAPQGVFLSVGPQGHGVGNWLGFVWKVFLQPSWLGGTKRNWKFIADPPNKEGFEALAKLVEEGKVKPLVDSVFSFEDTLKAYERILTGRATGKVIVKVDPNVE